MARRRSVTIEFLADEKNAVRGMKAVTRESETTGKKLVGLGRTAKLAIGTVATGAVAAFAVEAAKRGAEIETIMNRAGVVFGQNAADVERWAKDNRQNFGVSTSGLIDMVNQVGDLLVPLGLSRDQAADMSIEVLNLANALAEFNGVPVAQAADAVRKALLGERESLKELGVAINEADVSQRLATTGQAELTGEALKQAKALASLELITLSAKDAVTAYESGANEALGRQKELASNMAELNDEFAKLANQVGPPVVGVLADMTGAVGDFFAVTTPGHIQDITAAFQELGKVTINETTLGLSLGEEKARVFLDTLGKLGFSAGDVEKALGDGAEGVADFTDEVNEAALRSRDLHVVELAALKDGLKEVEEEFLAAADATDQQARAASAAKADIKFLSKAEQDLEADTEDATAAIQEQQRTLLEMVNPVMGMVDAHGRFIDAQQTVNELTADGKQNTAEYRDAQLDLVEAAGNLEAKRDALDGTLGDWKEAFRDLAESAGISSDEIDELIADIERLNRTDIVPKRIGGVVIAGGRGAGTGNVYRQHGGPVRRGQPYIVGERRPEVFVPNQNGTILPRVPRNTGGGSMTVNMTVNGSAGMDATTLARKVRDELVKLQRRNATTGIV